MLRRVSLAGTHVYVGSIDRRSCGSAFGAFCLRCLRLSFLGPERRQLCSQVAAQLVPNAEHSWEEVDPAGRGAVTLPEFVAWAQNAGCALPLGLGGLQGPARLQRSVFFAEKCLDVRQFLSSGPMREYGK